MNDPTVVGNVEIDSLPNRIDVNDLFDNLASPTEIPKFIQKTRSRANTVVTENEI